MKTARLPFAKPYLRLLTIAPPDNGPPEWGPNMQRTAQLEPDTMYNPGPFMGQPARLAFYCRY